MAAVAERPTAQSSGSGCRTVASRAKDWAQIAADQVAMRDKDLGVWREFTWGEVWELIDSAAHGLLALGVDVGDRVSIHSEDRPEWVIMDLAVVAVRGITVGLYPTNPHAEVEYTLNDCGSKVHLVEDEEQADKVLDLPAAAFPTVDKLIYVEPRGVRRNNDERLMDWQDFLALGRQFKADNGDQVSSRMAQATSQDTMTLVYTSGTTGPPKGAMLTNRNAEFCIDVVGGTSERMSNGKIPGPKDSVLTYLPLCHVAERVFSTWHLVGYGVVLNFAEGIETVNANLREIQPTVFFAVPRIWEKLHATIMIKGTDASRVKRLVFKPSMKLANWIGAKRVAADGGWPLSARLAYGVGYVLIFRALRERLGLRRARWTGSGAAPIAPELLQFFMGIGLDVFELYGMTENSAVATLNLSGRVKLGTVGEAYPSINNSVRVDETTGEVQTKHDGVFAGYWGKPDQTADTFTEDGWLKTGDVGEWVDGTHLKIIDRIKHIIITAGGKNISPSEIENALKTSPYINEAMVIGDRRKYLTALISIELETVGNWATRQNLSYTTYRDLTEKPEVVKLIEAEVDKTNERFARVEGIKKFRMIPKELDHEDGELTATQKLKRSAVENAFRDLVEGMYS